MSVWYKVQAFICCASGDYPSAAGGNVVVLLAADASVSHINSLIIFDGDTENINI